MKRAAIALFVALAWPGASAAQIVSDRNKHDALEHYRAGEEALHGERFDAAEREFREAVKLDPLLYFAHYGLGQTFMFSKRYPLAVLAYTDAREAFHKSAAESMRDEAGYQRQLEEQIRALELLRRTYADPSSGLPSGPGRPKVVDANSMIQRIDSQISNLSSARRHPEKPAEVPAWISLALGSAYFRSNQIADAEREYRETIRVEPKVGEAHNNLAVVLMLTGRYDEAEQEIKTAEKSGFRVNPQLKEDLKARRK
jgi:tetratricopeptide (TPR) repeat protein